MDLGKMWKEYKPTEALERLGYKSEWEYTHYIFKCYVEWNLHVNSPDKPNWVCKIGNRYYPLTSQDGYENLEDAKKDVEKSISRMIRVLKIEEFI